jgi:hypothetical protein
VLLANQLPRSGPPRRQVRATHAYRERLADSIDLFPIDALSSAVAMKLNCVLQLTMMANRHYRLLGERIGNGYATARFQHIFRDFINAAAHVVIGEHGITVCFEKRAYNPLLAAAGLAKTNLALPRLQNKKFRLTLG